MEFNEKIGPEDKKKADKDVKESLPYVQFLNGQMNEKEAEEFINDCLDNPEKLEKLNGFIDAKKFISGAIEEGEKSKEKLKEIAENLLKEIYKIDLNKK
jgi:hypothetical protein